MAQFLTALIVALLCGSYSCAQQAQPHTGDATAAVATPQPNFANEIRKTVGFLRVTYNDGAALKEISGTSFFVFYGDPRLGKNGGFGYLVTNRHMAFPGVEAGHPYPVAQIILLLNLKQVADRASNVAALPLGTPHWVVPEDESIDLAVTPLAPSQELFDFKMIPIDLLATKDVILSEAIGAGDTVEFAGYFYQWPGDKRIQPIVRQGVLAMMPDDEIKTTLQKPGHLYLADAHAFHGNSGSPVFVNVGGIRGNALVLNRNPAYLLGIISGYYPEGESFSVPAAQVLSREVHDNSGIATVVPAYQLKALMDSPTLQAQRDLAVTAQVPKQP